MQTKTIIGFIIIGMALGLIPIFFGDLDTLSQLAAATGVGTIPTAILIGFYNMGTGSKTPYGKRVLFSLIGSVVIILSAMLWH